MKRLITCFASLLFIGASIFGCSEEEPTASTISDAGLNIPAHLQGIENLTVYPADVEPTHDIDISFDLTYDEIENYTNQEFRIDARNRLILGRRLMQVYDSDGSFITDMGGVGQGPGEFAGFSQVNLQMTNTRLFGIDDINSRVNHFSLETYASTGSFLLDPAAWRRIDDLQSANIYPSKYFALNDSTLLVGFTERIPFDEMPNDEDRFNIGYRDIKYYRMNMNGQIVSDQVILQTEMIYCSSGEQRYCVPMPSLFAQLHFPYSVFEFNNSGQILAAETDEVMFQIYNQEGSYQSSFYYPIQRVVFDVHRMELSQEALEDYLEKENLPEHWPAFESMIIDDEDRIWLSLLTEDENTMRWWILSHEGHLLATFDWPGNRRISYGYRAIGIKAVKNGYIYSYELLDEELVEGQLSRHRFALTER